MTDRKTAEGSPEEPAPRYEAPKVETVLTGDDLEREGQYAGGTPPP